ncbi:DUF1853 family protein [Undibacterium arcticum]
MAMRWCIGNLRPSSTCWRPRWERKPRCRISIGWSVRIWATGLASKMRKMFDHQLMLAQHPAAQIHLPGPVQSAQALVKGWLFYAGVEQLPQSFGISPQHCRGFWRVLSELDAVVGDRFVVLPRLQWLAPAKATQDMVLSRQQLQSRLATHFGEHATPVLIAVMQESGNAMLEGSRGFIVPDDWPYRAQRAVPDGGPR